MKFETAAIHYGQSSDPSTGAVIVPVYQTSTYQQDGIGRHKGYEYSRTGNPTRTALENVLAHLEGGRYGLAFASGVDATAAAVNLLKSGDHAVIGDDIYGGTYRLLEGVFKRWGLETTYADADDPSAFERAVRDNTKPIWIETPTNPLLKVVDIALLARVAHERGALLAVDNTFAGPHLQRPIEWGADIVLHSMTKSLNGHSDVVAGIVVARAPEVLGLLRETAAAFGLTMDPHQAWLVLRGIRTLGMRVERAQDNARALASWLAEQPGIAWVRYPGLESHPQYELARRQMDGPGSVIAFELAAGLDAGRRMMDAVKLVTLAVSLGGVESLVEHPASMTHSKVPASEQLRQGITPGLVRLAVGCEDLADLRADLAQALAAAVEVAG